MFTIKIGQIIKELRNEKGLSASELARRSGISQPYLSQLETGKNNNPTTEVIEKIAKGLGVHYTALMYRAGHISADEVGKHWREEALKTEVERTLNNVTSDIPEDEIKNVITRLNIQKNDAINILNDYAVYEVIKTSTNEIEQLYKNYTSSNDIEIRKQIVYEEMVEALNSLKMRNSINIHPYLTNKESLLHFNDYDFTEKDKEKIIKFIETFIIERNE